jgi:hypothetical protein
LFKSFCRVVSVLTTLWKQFEFRLVRFVIYLTVSKNVKGIRSPTLRRFSFGSDKILFKWNRLILFGSTKLISINFFKTKKKKKWYYNENLADKSQVEPSFRSRCLGSRNYSVYPSWPVMMDYEYWQDIWHIHFWYASKRICLVNHAVSGSSESTG